MTKQNFVPELPCFQENLENSEYLIIDYGQSWKSREVFQTPPVAETQLKVLYRKHKVKKKKKRKSGVEF